MSSKVKNMNKERQYQASGINDALNREKVKTGPDTVLNKKNVKKKKRYLIYLLLLAITGIVGTVIALSKFYGKDSQKRNASVTLEFTYDGAAQNLTPNGEQFSINGITDEKIITRAIENAGFSDRYSYSDIVQNIKVTASYPQDVIQKINDYNSLYDFSGSRSVSVNDYYPTLYRIQLYDGFDPSASDSDMKAIAEAIAEEYKKDFIGKYIYAYDPERVSDLLLLSGYDYSQRVKIIRRRLQALENYALMMYKKDLSFKYHGMSFNDFSIKCRLLDNDSLSNIEASVMTDGLTTSVNRLKNQYEYEIKLLESELEYKKENIEEINALIDSYQIDSKLYISSGDSFAVVESNSKETYQKLIDKKRELSERLVEIGSEIDRYKMYLANLKAVSYSSSVKNRQIEGRIDTVYEKLTEMEDYLGEMIGAYNLTRISDPDVIIGDVSYNASKLISRSFAVMAVKCAGPLCLLMMIAFSFIELSFEVRKVRK